MTGTFYVLEFFADDIQGESYDQTFICGSVDELKTNFREEIDGSEWYHFLLFYDVTIFVQAYEKGKSVFGKRFKTT